MKSTTKNTGKIFSLVFTISLIFLMTAAIIPGVQAASAVNLGSAGNFAILSKTGVTTTGTTTITGDIGVSPIAAASITGFGLVKDSSNQFSRSSLVSGKIYAADYTAPTPATLTTAVSNMEAAYTDAAGRAGPTATDLYAGNLGGRTLAPGVYKWSTGVLIPASTTLTLDAQGDSSAVWIFQISGDLTMNSASGISLINGAQADNVYWQIAGPAGASIGSGARASGNILTQKAITMNSGASLNGRALAQTAVTLIADTVTSPTGSATLNTAPVQAVGTTTTNVGITSVQTSTTLPGQTVTATTSPRTGIITMTIPIGGNSGVYRADVTGTGINSLVLTGTTTTTLSGGVAQAPGIVYEYFDMVPAQYTAIDQATIYFTVPISWLNDNHIPLQNVVLYQADGSSWTAHPTTYVETSGSQAYYTATTSSFTRFAITGQFTSDVTSVQTVNPVTPLITQTAPITMAPTQPSLTPTAKSPVPVWLPVIALIGGLLIMGILSGRGRKNS